MNSALAVPQAVAADQVAEVLLEQPREAAVGHHGVEAALQVGDEERIGAFEPTIDRPGDEEAARAKNGIAL